jgi:hypothetical protein
MTSATRSEPPQYFPDSPPFQSPQFFPWRPELSQSQTPSHALKYLAPYIYRIAITNNRIEKLENGQVTFRFKNSDTNQCQTTTLPALVFIHRFLQHVLPKGFVKIRYYGFLSPLKRNLLAVAKYLLGDIRAPEVTSTPAEQHVCPFCGAKLRLIKSLPKSTRAPP